MIYVGTIATDMHCCHHNFGQQDDRQHQQRTDSARASFRSDGDRHVGDISIASKLLDAAGRMDNSDRARQYFLIATSTYVEIAEAMNTPEVSATKQSAEIELALAELGKRLRDYRATLPQSSLAES